jgi:hypothetical protein
MAQYTGGRVPTYTGEGMFDYSVALTAATATTAGLVCSLANPLGVDVILCEAYVDITTAATTATNTMDIGVAANGTTSADTLFDGKAAAAGLFTSDLATGGGTNGLVPRKWAAASYVTGTASATLVGMVANLHLILVRA